MCASAAELLHGDPMGLPIGLQLYTISAELNGDLAGTLKKVADIGYRTVEWPKFSSTASPSEYRSILDRVGLKCPSVHYSMFDLQAGFDQALDGAHALGSEYIICAAPGVRNPSRLNLPPNDGLAQFRNLVNNVDLDDWKWNADQLNHYGEQARKAGLQLGYHNHNVEFKKFGDVLPSL